jgi:hypothetical protein
MSFEAPQESVKDKLINSGIAKIAFDSAYSKYPTLLEDMDMTLNDLDFRAGYFSDEKEPEIIIEMPNTDPKTKDRVPTTKIFVSDASGPFTENLDEEQRKILLDLCEEAGVVTEGPDDLVKERVERVSRIRGEHPEASQEEITKILEEEEKGL